MDYSLPDAENSWIYKLNIVQVFKIKEKFMILDSTISIGHKVIKNTNSAKLENNIDHIRI